MCGFIGYTSLLNQDIKLHQDKFDNYHGKMFHRGPDFQKKIEISNQSRKFNLGFSRLSIQDSSINANRIFYNQNFILLFNGELYNKSFLVKKYFNEMVELKKILKVEDLSMGMSEDYLDAIACGASYVRIGSKIFGNRT